MEQAAAQDAAALISVVTDAYPSRYWCRREVELARTPKIAGDAGAMTIWTVQPTIAVERAGPRWSRPLPQLAQVPRLGWTDSHHEQSARLADVVDRLLLETLLIGYYRRRAEKTAKTVPPPPRTSVALTTWVPDP
ncbi:MAG: hypothetical protein AAF628_22060 [Planctomycetota bacterium]